MIATLCKSCNTISLVIIDRCKYCGSQRVETKFLNDSEVIHRNNRYQLVIQSKAKKIEDKS